MKNLYEPIREAVDRLRPILAPNDAVEEFFFDQICRATVLIDVAERRIASAELSYDRYQRVLAELNRHRGWLHSSLQYLSKLQAERAQSNPAQPPTRLARVYNLKPARSHPAIPAAATAPQDATTPRNALCPCGSGEKYKRCCGKSAPPILHHAAAA